MKNVSCLSSAALRCLVLLRKLRPRWGEALTSSGLALCQAAAPLSTHQPFSELACIYLALNLLHDEVTVM